ncbi:MAG: DsrE/DsrF/DrsH-like family protein [Rhodospirillaceae bacterium]|nr:DsrE/DsrF/DrsH-like family protein [Rhodospirillaceae bacterium]
MPDGVQDLSIIVFDGAYDRVHYALVLASAAAASNRRATLFFTGHSLVALTPGGWRRLGGDPEAEDARAAACGTAGFAELLAACRELGVRFIACEMGLRLAGLAAEALTEAPVEIAGVVTVLNATPAGAQMLFI